MIEVEDWDAITYDVRDVLILDACRCTMEHSGWTFADLEAMGISCEMLDTSFRILDGAIYIIALMAIFKASGHMIVVQRSCTIYHLAYQTLRGRSTVT